MTKVLFLHGFDGQGRGSKYDSLNHAGFTLAPPPDLPYPDMHGAIALAQQVHDEHRPDVIVGSSLGGAVALQLQTTAGLVLMAPAISLREPLKHLAKFGSMLPEFFLKKLPGSDGFLPMDKIASLIEHVYPFLRNPPSPWAIPTKCVVIQSQDDEFFSLAAPESLIRKASGAAPPPDRDTIDRIEQGLVAAGYQPLAGRLVEAGCDHQLNSAAEGTPPGLRPHAVMVKAVQILAAI